LRRFEADKATAWPLLSNFAARLRRLILAIAIAKGARGNRSKDGGAAV